MFGLGIWEVVVVLAVALIVLGPRKLPDVARQLAQMVREFRRATNELRYSIDDATVPRPPVVEPPPPVATETESSKPPPSPPPSLPDEAKPGEPNAS